MPTSGTRTFAALAGLGVIWAISGCFNVNYSNCRFTCSNDDDCPGSLTCVDNGTGLRLCAQEGTMTCAPSTDAGADTGGLDAGGDDSADAMDGSDSMDGGDGGDAGGPPEVLCHGGDCFTLPAAVRAKLVLLLWPSNLPAVGSAVVMWPDQSGQGNHARAIYPAALPHVIQNGVQLDANQYGSGFEVVNSPSLDFGAGDFAVIVVAGLSSSTAPVTFFRKSDGVRENRRGISIDWVLTSATTGRPQGFVNETLVETGMDTTQPSVRAYSLRRATDYLELYLNEAILRTADLTTAGASTSNVKNVFLGVSDPAGEPVDSLAAVIAIRGSIESADLNALQGFLRRVFAAP